MCRFVGVETMSCCVFEIFTVPVTVKSNKFMIL